MSNFKVGETVRVMLPSKDIHSIAVIIEVVDSFYNVYVFDNIGSYKMSLNTNHTIHKKYIFKYDSVGKEYIPYEDRVI